MIIDDLKLCAWKKKGKQVICCDGFASAVHLCLVKGKTHYCSGYCIGVYRSVHCTSLVLIETAGSHSLAYQSHNFSRQKRIKRLLTLSRGGEESRGRTESDVNKRLV